MCRISVIVGVVSGIFALAGCYFGALLTRRIEHEKWLRRERSEAFAEFLKQLHVVVDRAIPILSGLEPKQQQDSKVTELFLGLKAQEYVVRLYLPPTDRQSFSSLAKELWQLHSPSIKMERRVRGVEETLQNIQSLFERTIDGKSPACMARRGKGKSP